MADKLESSDLLSAMVALSPDHIAVQNRDLRYLMVVNPQLGLTEQGMLGRTDLEILPTADAARLTEVKRRVLETGETLHLELALPSLNGAVEHFDGTYVPMRGASGEVTGLIGYLRNVTERKRSEEELQLSARRLRRANVIARIGNWEWDVRTGELHWEGELYGISGLSRDVRPSLEGFLSIVHPEDVAHLRGAVQQALEGLPLELDLRILRPDGSVRFVHTAGEVQRDATGAPLKLFGAVQDVTERKRSEEALRLSEERLRLANKATRDVVWDWDVTADTQMWNESGAEVFGWTDIVQAPQSAHWWVERVHPDDRQRVDEGFFAVVNDPTAGFWQAEYRFRRADGTYAEVMDRGHVLRDAQGKAVRMIGAMLDVSERKRALEDLRRGAALYDAIKRTTRDGLWLLDAQGRLLEANEAACRMSGYSEAELTSMRVSDLEGAETPTQTEAHISRVRERGEDRFETRHRGKDGSLIDVEVSVQHIPMNGGRFVCFLRDITERARAERAVRASEERYRKLFTSMSMGSAVNRVVCDAEGRAVDYVVLDINHAYERMLGARREAVVGRKASELLPPDELADWLARFAPVALKGETGHWEACSRRLRKHFDVTAYCPEPGHFVAMFVDVTAEKNAAEEKARLEERLHHSQKMEAVGTLAGGVAHDFNNILGGLLSGLSILELDLGGRSAAHAEDLRDMKELVQRGADLSKQLLGFSRRGKYDARPLDLGAVVRKTAAMFGRTRRDISILQDVAPDLAAVVMDHAQLEQALLNLFLNAGQAMPHGGRLVIWSGNVELDEAQTTPRGVAPGRFVRLVVTDTGTGMDAATRARIFEPFFTTKAKGHGCGLGLASVYGIVTNHGGFIDVESAPGAGTTFTIHLPASDLPALDDSAAAATIHSGHGTILVVDDEAQLLKLSERLLRAMGYEVLTASDGQAAIELVRQHRDELSLVILDMTMPEMSGAATFDAIRAIAPKLKVLLASGFSLEGQAQALLDQGCNGFIQKPFDAAALSEKIRTLV